MNQETKTHHLSEEKHVRLANAIRILSMDAVEKAKSGHPGMPMGMADVTTVLFSEFLKLDKNLLFSKIDPIDSITSKKFFDLNKLNPVKKIETTKTKDISPIDWKKKSAVILPL